MRKWRSGRHCKSKTYLAMINGINCSMYNFIAPRKGPVTLLRMRETYEKRMEINEIIFIRTKIL
jgi:hypothetical protein